MIEMDTNTETMQTNKSCYIFYRFSEHSIFFLLVSFTRISLTDESVRPSLTQMRMSGQSFKKNDITNNRIKVYIMIELFSVTKG